MSGETYLHNLKLFVGEHNIPRDLASRMRKINEEAGEVAEALINRNLSAATEELCDLVNTGFIALMSVTANPWGALLENLKEKDHKYKIGGQRTEKRR